MENSFINHLEDEYKNVYKGTDYNNKISGVDKKTIEKALQNSWVADGKTFSDRIWANSDKIIRDITKNIAVNIASGQGVGTLSKEISKKYNVLLWQASRLVQTETAAIKSKATLQRYEDDEIEFYQILVTNDERTSDICRKFLNSDKVYKVKEAQIGVNYPPFHVNCRTTTIAYFEDLDDKKDKDITGSAKLNDDVYTAIKKEFKGLNSREIILRTERLEHIKFRHPEVIDLLKENYKKIIEDPDYILKDSKYDDTIWNIKRIEDKGLIMVIKLIIDKSGGYKNSIITCFRINDKITNKHIKNKKVIYIKNK